MRQTLLQVAKSTGRIPKELAGHSATPPFFKNLWSCFISLRNSGEVFTYHDYMAWSKINRIKLPSWQIDLLFELAASHKSLLIDRLR